MRFVHLGVGICNKKFGFIQSLCRFFSSLVVTVLVLLVWNSVYLMGFLIFFIFFSIYATFELWKFWCLSKNRQNLCLCTKVVAKFARNFAYKIVSGVYTSYHKFFYLIFHVLDSIFFLLWKFRKLPCDHSFSSLAGANLVLFVWKLVY